jgi:uncharacterized protein YjiS (DUF1127 family)
MIRTYVDPGFRSLSPTFAGLNSPVRVGPNQPRHEAWPSQVARAGGRSWLARSAGLLLAWSERARQRRDLLRFDDHLLRDIGLTRAEALAEAEKPFWRA